MGDTKPLNISYRNCCGVSVRMFEDARKGYCTEYMGLEAQEALKRLNKIPEGLWRYDTE